MAYASWEHIQSEFKDLDLSCSTKITLTEVNRYIQETDAEINGAIGLIYSTPVTQLEPALILRTICIDIVVDRIKRILGVKTGVEEADQGEGDTQADKARARLKQIQNKEILLTGASPVESGGLVSSYNVSAGIEHKFKRDTTQW